MLVGETYHFDVERQDDDDNDNDDDCSPGVPQAATFTDATSFWATPHPL